MSGIMRTIAVTLIALSLALSACTSLQQPPTYYVAGFVRSVTDRPVEGAEVTIIIDGNSGHYSSFSDRYGRYRIPEVPLGQAVLVRCSKSGYQEYEESLVLDDADEPINIYLTSMP